MGKNEALSTLSYDVVVAQLRNAEAAEKSRLMEAAYTAVALKQVETKYEILRITAKYGLLMSMISIYEGMLQAFLASSNNRLLFLGHQPIKVNVDASDEEYGQLVQSTDPTYGAKSEPRWIEWKGCEMTIPASTHIMVAHDITWPTLYMKGKDSTDEIRIHERAWNADVYASRTDLVKKTEGEIIDEGLHAFDQQNTTTSFKTVRLEVSKKLQEFDLVLEIPVNAPYLDVLTKVSFKDSAEADIVLTFALC